GEQRIGFAPAAVDPGIPLLKIASAQLEHRLDHIGAPETGGCVRDQLCVLRSTLLRESEDDLLPCIPSGIRYSIGFPDELVGSLEPGGQVVARFFSGRERSPKR